MTDEREPHHGVQSVVRALSILDALAQSDTRVTTAVIALYKALGGGWETPVPPAPFPTTAAATAPATQPGLPTETVP